LFTINFKISKISSIFRYYLHTIPSPFFALLG